VFAASPDAKNIQRMSSSSLPVSPPYRQTSIYKGDIRLSSSLHSRSNPEPEQLAVPDLLTVFQAAPLAFRSSTGDAVPLPALGFERERQILNKAIREASFSAGRQIDVDFQIATTDRLGFFLAQEEGQLMHFSCHGHQE
jgi:hypothetical protein